MTAAHFSRIDPRRLPAGLTCVTVAAALSACSVFGGIGGEKLESPYSVRENTVSPGMILEAEADAAGEDFSRLLASDLCVLSDESSFSADELDAEAGAIFDLGNEKVLYSKNAFEKLYPASITKVMTAIIAIKYGNLSDSVTVTEDSVITESGASLCGIRPGDTLTLEQLLYGLMLPSGNDAGAAIAIHMSGSIDAFAQRMNEEARAIGATSTHFVNPHGLTDEEHYTTAYDLYLIFNEALKLPEFRRVTQTLSYEADYTNAAGEPVHTTWEGGNWYMTGRRDEPEGVTVFSGKTGTTQAAGYCLIIASQDEKGDEYISVVLKASSRDNLYANMTKLISKIVN